MISKTPRINPDHLSALPAKNRYSSVFLKDILKNGWIKFLPGELKIFSLLSILLLVSHAVLPPVEASELPIRILHNPVSFATSGKPINIKVTLDGDVLLSDVEEAVIYFRTLGQMEFDQNEMDFVGREFSGTIPAEMVSTQGIEYYIKITIAGNRFVGFPEIEPDLNPLSVAVSESKQKKSTKPKKSSLVIISPEPDSEQEEQEAQILVAFNRAVRKLNPEKIQIRLDNMDITDKAVITKDILIATIPDVSFGQHKIDVLYKTKKGRLARLGGWSFKIRGKEEAKKITLTTVRGSAGFNGIYREMNGQVSRLAYEDFSIRVGINDLRMIAAGKFSSEENSNIQPQHRYFFELGTEKYTIRAGDVNPRYNKLAFWGRRTRGVELDLRPGKFWIQSVYGEMRRSIGTKSINVIREYGQDGEIESIDTTFSGGTFRRWVGAMRLSYNPSRSLSVGYMLMKAKDDVTSILGGDKPKDNLVYGLDINAFADRRRISFNSNMAISMFTDDTNLPPIEGTESGKSIIWINQTFDPLPKDTSASLSNFFGSIFGKTFSADSRLRVRYFDNDLQFGAKRISRSFHTLSNPNMTRDRQGYFIQDRIRLLKSKLYLDFGYNSYHNNIFGLNDITESYNQFNTGFSVYTGEMFPDFSISYRNRENTSDAEAFYIIDGDINDPDSTLIDDRKLDQTNFITFNTMYNFSIMNTTNNVTATVMTSDRTDEYHATGAAEQKMYNINMNTEYEGLPLRTSIGYSLSDQNTGNGLSEIQSQTITMRMNLGLMNRKLNPYFGPRITLGNGFNELSSEEPSSELLYAVTPKSIILDFMRIDWSGGVMYAFLPNHSIQGGISYSMQSESNKLELWNGDELPVPTDTDGKNNMIATVGYQYRF
ncbi:MAG: hypothetical protein P9L92_01735 [Candidatus Electryonea clarkiae]|nr:hypothetical protein [Candidatus Electryonea clarkiae]MDP8285103.1 hypothetical protein [Candidatus Electryonea clarkiae]